MKAGAKKWTDCASHFNARLAYVVLLSTLLYQCAPIASELQSARLVGRHNLEVTPGYADVKFREASSPVETGRAIKSGGHMIGIQAAYGISDRVDIRLRFEQIQFMNKEQNVFAIGPKVSLIKDHLSLYVPVWFVDFKPAQTQPSLLITLPLIKNMIEVNPSVKTILSVSAYDPTNSFMAAANLGFGISTNLQRWALRPEYGMVYDLRNGNRFSSISVGLTLYLGRRFGR